MHTLYIFSKKTCFVIVLAFIFGFTTGQSQAEDTNGLYKISMEKTSYAKRGTTVTSPFRIFSNNVGRNVQSVSTSNDTIPVQSLHSASPGNVSRYTVIAIEPLTGYVRSIAQGINNEGQVAGRFYNWDEGTGSSIDRRAFFWDPSTGSRVLSTLNGDSSAWALNDNGFASGWSSDESGYQRAARWDTSGETIIDIGAFTNTNPEPDVVGNTSSAYELNNNGNVVGNADIPNDDESFTAFHAFLYTDSSGIQDLGTFASGVPYYQNGYSIAYDITNSGVIIGCAHNNSWTLLPFIYDETNGMQELNRNPSYSGSTEEWYAVAMNESGLIGGHVISVDNVRRPHYWSDSTSVPVEITMPSEFPNGEIYGINNRGHMVGIMWDDVTGEEHGFIFDIENGLRDLNDLIPSGSGWVLTYARDINNAGQIVGFGDFNGEKRGFVLKPVYAVNPSIYMLLLRE